MATILTDIARELGLGVLWRAKARLEQLRLAARQSRALTYRRESGEVQVGVYPRRLGDIERRDGYRHDAGVTLTHKFHPHMERHGARIAAHEAPEGSSDLTFEVRLPLLGYVHAGVVLPRDLPPWVKRWIRREPYRSTFELGVWLGPLADDWCLGLHWGDPNRYDYAPEKPAWQQRPIEIPVDPRRILLGRLLRVELSKVESEEVLPLPERLYPCRVEVCRYRAVREGLQHFTWAGRTYYSNTVHFLDEDGVDTGHRKDPIYATGAGGENAQEAVGHAVGWLLYLRKRYGWKAPEHKKKEPAPGYDRVAALAERAGWDGAGSFYGLCIWAKVPYDDCAGPTAEKGRARAIREIESVCHERLREVPPAGIDPGRVAAWDAINRYAASCGGAVNGPTGPQPDRMDAVCAVERALSDLRGKPEDMGAEPSRDPERAEWLARRDAELVERAVRAAHTHSPQAQPLWAVIKHVFNTGSQVAQALCRRFGRDPDEDVEGLVDENGTCATCGVTACPSCGGMAATDGFCKDCNGECMECAAVTPHEDLLHDGVDTSTLRCPACRTGSEPRQHHNGSLHGPSGWTCMDCGSTIAETPCPGPKE